MQESKYHSDSDHELRLLEECRRCEDAIASYDRAIVLEPDEAAKDFLKDRLRAPR